MKNHLFLFLLLSLSISTFSQRVEKGNIVTENIPPIPDSLSQKLAQYQNTRTASFSSWLPGGKGMLISTRFGETAQIHAVEMPAGARKQITFFNEPVTSAVIPKGSRDNTFYFLKDVGGGEFYQVYSFDMNTGKYEMLTDGTSRNGSPSFSPDATKFIYSSTRRNKKDYDLYIANTSNPKESKMIAELSGMWGPGKWSPDGKKVIAGKYVSVNESFLFIMDAETGKMEEINPGKKGISYGGEVWAQNGKGIYIISDENREFKTLHYYDLQTKTFTPLTTSINWDIEALQISDDGKKIAFSANEDAIERLYIMDTETNRFKRVESIPKGLLGGFKFHPNNQDLAITIYTSDLPGDVFVLNTNSSELTRWTFSETGGLNPATFISPELIHYETFDKVGKETRKIPAFYFKPKNVKKKLPVLISIHGGPESQSRPSFASSYQFMLNELEIAIIVPNVRGSTGYGKSFVKLDNGFKREESVQDIGKLLDWIAKQPELDADRVMVYGGSYGGYMVLACMTHFNDRLRGGIDLFGISNFITFLEKTEAYRRDMRRAEYGDETDPEMKKFLQKISPLSNVDKIRKPVFIYQGKNDPRVPENESEQMVEALKKNNVPVWYMLAKDEGHSLNKKTNKDFHTAATMLFLQKYLLK